MQNFKTMTMKNLFFIALLALLTFGIGCSNSVTITTDYDKKADFTQYKTFGFLKWNEQSSALVNDLDRRRLEAAVTTELEKRGMTRVDDMGDTMIGFHVVTEEKTGTTSYTDYYGGMGYYGRGFGYGYGYPYGGAASTTTSTYNYVIGTVVIDQYDSKSKDLIWEGVAQGEVQNDKSKREENIKADLLKMFQDYPIPAANTTK